MRKSKDITKYEPVWQMVRAKVKGPSTNLDDKLRIVNSYFDQHQTVDAWERVVNWLEGLQMGYRSSGDTEAIERIAVEISNYNGRKPSAKEPELTRQGIFDGLKQYSYADRLQLWRDLFDRNKKWLVKGYNHSEHNEFMDVMYELFAARKEQIPTSVSKEKLDELRKNSASTTNTHKFFF